MFDRIPFRFSGKILDTETALYYYGARYMDPRTSRWISSDPALKSYVPVAPVDDEAKKHNQNLPGMGGVFNPVNLNTYHYAGNNPIKYVDPTGEFSLQALGALIGFVAGAASGYTISMASNASTKDMLINVAIGAGGGAIAGVAATIPGAGAGVGAIMGATTNIITQRVTGDGKVDLGQVVVATALGTVLGTGGNALSGEIAAVAAPELAMLAEGAVAYAAGNISGGLTTLMEMNDE